MSDIADLKQRVNEATEHFGRLAEKDQTNHSRLANLLTAVEKNLTRSHEEIERLNGELARTRGENEQLRAMLQGLVEQVETKGSTGVDDGLRALEERLSGLLSTHVTGADDLGPSPVEAAVDPVAGAVDTGQPAKPALEATFGATPDAAHESTTPPEAAPAEAEVSPPLQGGEPPPDEAKPEAEEGKRAAATPMGGVPSDADLSAVNRIIQRVSLLTGEFRGKDKSDEDAGESEGEAGGGPGAGEQAARGT